MSVFVLDTDILKLFERGQAVVEACVAEHDPTEIAISVVTVEEQLSGWYDQLRKAKSPEKLAWAYRRLASAVRFLSRVQILDCDESIISAAASRPTRERSGPHSRRRARCCPD